MKKVINIILFFCGIVLSGCPQSNYASMSYSEAKARFFVGMDAKHVIAIFGEPTYKLDPFTDEDGIDNLCWVYIPKLRFSQSACGSDSGFSIFFKGESAVDIKEITLNRMENKNISHHEK